ncbi:MAG: hypothetical protein NUW01_01305 [Gemmatimonadaceae bacterium]|nr:hypothetical protein [Gemmatimonadaceae bacterium]
MTPDTEREDLEALIASAGWKRFAFHALSEWDSKFAEHAARAANITDDKLAIDRLRQVIAIQQEVKRLLAWPGERLSALAGIEQQRAPSLSRRGPL